MRCVNNKSTITRRNPKEQCETSQRQWEGEHRHSRVVETWIIRFWFRLLLFTHYLSCILWKSKSNVNYLIDTFYFFHFAIDAAGCRFSVTLNCREQRAKMQKNGRSKNWMRVFREIRMWVSRYPCACVASFECCVDCFEVFQRCRRCSNNSHDSQTPLQMICKNILISHFERINIVLNNPFDVSLLSVYFY